MKIANWVFIAILTLSLAALPGLSPAYAQTSGDTSANGGFFDFLRGNNGATQVQTNGTTGGTSTVNGTTTGGGTGLPNTGGTTGTGTTGGTTNLNDGVGLPSTGFGDSATMMWGWLAMGLLLAGATPFILRRRA